MSSATRAGPGSARRPGAMILAARQATPASHERLAGMDALRGGAMLLGVFIHAAISYMPSNLASLYWGIREERTSAIVDAVFWWIHTCRLPLFFVIAGFFAVMVRDGKGPAGFLAHRCKRLLVPYLAGLATILPLAYVYAWACGVVAGQVNDPDITSFEIAPRTWNDLCGPMHLWFLQDLMILSTIFIGAAWLRRPSGFGVPHPETWGEGEPSGFWSGGISFIAPLALALPTALILWFDARPLVAHPNTFMPIGIRLLYYGYFFAVGAGLYRYRRGLTETFAWPLTHLILAVPAGVLVLTLIPGHLHGSLDAAESLLLALSAGLLAWFSIFGLMGLALRCFPGKHPLANYLADASYWVYLIHLPIVCLLQLDLAGLDLPPEIKCALVVGITVGLGLATYQTMVRYTFLGNWLHGPRISIGPKNSSG